MRVVLELEEEDFVRLMDLQHEILAVLERIEKLLQEQTNGNDTRKRVKEAVRKQLRSVGAYHFFPATGGYGKSGVPDIVGCFRGKFLVSNVRQVTTSLPHYKKRTYRKYVKRVGSR